jgi:hypothetical protein
MPLRDFLNLTNEVSIIKTISTLDGMGGSSASSSTFVIPLCVIWQNGSNNKWISDKYAKDSTHTLVYEYGTYTFNDKSSLTSSQTLLETITYGNETYKIVGFTNNVMNLNEIMVQALERTS